AFLAAAVIATPISHAAKTRQRCDRPVDNPQHLTKGDLRGVLEEHIATGLAAAARDNAVVLQVKQDLLEELLRDALLLGNVGNEKNIAPRRIGARQSDQRAKGIFCFL